MRGCIIKRKNKWAFVVEIGKHPTTGRRRQKWFSGFETKAAAEAELAKVLVQMGEGKELFEPTNQTIEKFFESWMRHKKQHVRSGTYTTYTWAVNYHIVRRLGYVKLAKLTPQHLITVYDQMLNEGLAPQTVKHIHKILGDGLETAVSWGLIEKNVTMLVKPPKVTKKEMKIWDEAQLAQFFKEFTNERYHTLFLVAATTGMRRGEVLGLKWEDIDFQQKKLSVRRSYVRGYGTEYVFQEPKTTAGFRTITLPEQTVMALKKHRRWQLADRLASEHYENQDLVFCKQDGGPLTPQQLSGVWIYFFKKSTLPRIRFHDLRHTHASMLLKAGVHPKVVSERLGHASVSITLDRYSHLLPGLQEAAAAKINGLLNIQ